MRPGYRDISITLACAAVLRLGLVFFYPHDPLTPDSVNYLDLAGNLLKNHSLSYDGLTPALGRAPGYPLFIALTGAVAGGIKIPVILAAQALLDSVTAVYVLALASFFLPGNWALAAGLFYALHPVFSGFTGIVLSETLFMHFWVLFLVLFRRALDSGNKAWAAAGVVLALGVLTRPVHMFYPLPAAFLLAIRKPDLKAGATGFLLFLATFAAVIAPWTIRNYNASGLFIPVITGGKAAVWLGSLDHFPTPEDVAAVWKGPDYKSVEAERAFAAAASKNWKENTRNILLHMPHRFRKFWFTSHSSVFRVEMPNSYYRQTGQFRALAFKAFLLGLQLLTLAGAAAGAWLLRREWRDALFLLMPAAFVCAHILNDWGPARYHISALPGLAILAVWGLRKYVVTRGETARQAPQR